jgi:hypothetical protein
LLVAKHQPTYFNDPFAKTRDGVRVREDVHLIEPSPVWCNNSLWGRDLWRLAARPDFARVDPVTSLSLRVSTKQTQRLVDVGRTVEIPIPLPYMQWVQRDSFHTLWVLTRWCHEETKILLPDTIRAYIVHLVRDTDQDYEGCCFCTNVVEI